MRPRASMSAISDDATVPEMIAAAQKFRHRRVPIYDESPDTIVGILNTRALLLNPGIDLADAIEFPSFVPESMNLLVLFRALQKQQRGLAMVLDEFGGTAGITAHNGGHPWGTGGAYSLSLGSGRFHDGNHFVRALAGQRVVAVG